MNNKTIKILLILLFGLFEFATVYLIDEIANEKETHILSKRLELLNARYESTVHDYSKLSTLIFNEVVNKPEVLQLLSDMNDKTKQNEIRDRLYEMLLPTYTRLNSAIS